MDLLNLKGKVAIVTGASSGIGLGVTKAFAANGVKVAMVDISDKGFEVASEIEGAEFFKCNVTIEAEVKATVEAIAKKFGTINFLFNNAGVAVRKTVVDLTEKEWDLVLNVGLKGTFLFSKYTIPYMVQNGGGSIVNTGSGWGLKGGGNAAAYCAVKGGIVNLTRAMAIDHGHQNIRVNSVNPGDVDTAMLRSEGLQTGEINEKVSVDDYLKACGSDRPLGRIGTPNDIANAVMFLCSDMAGWVTGAALVVDGGGIA